MGPLAQTHATPHPDPLPSSDEGRGSQRAARLPSHSAESHREWVCVMVLLAGWQVDRSFAIEATDSQGVECGLKGQKVVGSGFPTLRKTQTGVGFPPPKARETQTASRSASLKAREPKRSSVRRPRRLRGAKLPAVCLPRSLNGGKRTSVSYFRGHFLSHRTGWLEVGRQGNAKN